MIPRFASASDKRLPHKIGNSARWSLISDVTRVSSVDRPACARTQEPSASKVSTTRPSLPPEACVGAKPAGHHDRDARHRPASFTPPFRALVVADNEVASRIPVTYHVPPRLFHHIKPGRLAAIVPEELKNWSHWLSMSKREPRYIFCTASATRGQGCITDPRGVHEPTRKAVALFAVTVSTAVGTIHPLEQTEERCGVPLARRRVIPIRPNSASTRHVALATRRATDQTTG